MSCAIASPPMSGFAAIVRRMSLSTMPDELALVVEHREHVLPRHGGDLLDDLARRRARRERRVRPVAHEDVADAHAREHVEDEVLAVRGRVALGRRPARGRAMRLRRATNAMPSASISGTSRS